MAQLPTAELYHTLFNLQAYARVASLAPRLVTRFDLPVTLRFSKSGRGRRANLSAAATELQRIKGAAAERGLERSEDR